MHLRIRCSVANVQNIFALYAPGLERSWDPNEQGNQNTNFRNGGRSFEEASSVYSTGTGDGMKPQVWVAK